MMHHHQAVYGMMHVAYMEANQTISEVSVHCPARSMTYNNVSFSVTGILRLNALVGADSNCEFTHQQQNKWDEPFISLGVRLS